LVKADDGKIRPTLSVELEKDEKSKIQQTASVESGERKIQSTSGESLSRNIGLIPSISVANPKV
jgi:hypothetical protein